MGIKNIKKNINERKCIWNDFQNTIYGSIICTANALREDHLSDDELLKRAEKAKFPLSDDPEVIEKTLEAVGFNKDALKDQHIAAFISPYNVLIAPFIWVEDEETGDMKISGLTYRRDGLIPRTIEHYTDVKIIDWGDE